MEIYTIGFTKKTAERFFELLKTNGIKRLIDIRLNNVSQLAGFAKKKDLQYFLKQICGAEYMHLPILAPSRDILDAYKKNKGGWSVFEQSYLKLAESRKIESEVEKSLFDQKSVFLCSEHEPQNCHRRLIAEYLSRHWGDVDIHHL